MIAVNTCGGLGNQLFQYAFARSLSEKHKVSLLNSCTQYGNTLEHFNITLPILPHPGWRWIAERSLRFDSNPEIEENSILAGYWQCERYFKNVEKELRREITLNHVPSQNCLSVVDKIEKTPNSVFMHVRRGDYLTWAAQRHGVLPLSYYLQSTAYIMERVENAHFFVFSDDQNYVPEIPCNMTAVHLTPSEDLTAMRACKHAVIANSSFSWWGAWLSSAQHVVAPKQWFATGNEDSTDIVPDRWVRL